MDPFANNLQVPELPSPGPSRPQGYNRPVSVQPTSTTSPSASSRSRVRASHSVVTGQQQQEDTRPPFRDVYSHPAAVEYAAAHPRRQIPKFGPYILLQTLGEGEFGKVKLGLHMEWCEEVAVKLIRRGNLDSSVRMSKVEREIEVLRTLKHPNIVRLYDVIETDKYIGIILEYASGGELFDHILAHRYLREKDACKLFSQLLSGVWYIHQKKIVHRDLKLENLLLDRNRNVIITDFGFANRFEHKADDLMQTSCGSPCYAAPELVISDGLYVGSAVDIWSCGVILYAMLAGYLPFDDDPANPDGDNINLLYKYIVNTPLSFPEYISADARDLLSIMLVPDPSRRADLETIMKHRWLAPYASLFSKSVDELEQAAIEQHNLKRAAYQKQMRQMVEQQNAAKVHKSHSTRTDTYSGPTRSHRHQQPEYLYETSGDHSAYAAAQSSRRGVNSAIVVSSPLVQLDDDPFAPPPSAAKSTNAPISMVTSPVGDVTEERREGVNGGSAAEVAGTSSAKPTIEPVKTSPDAKRPKGPFRHTIQVEVPESEAASSSQQHRQNHAQQQEQTSPKRSPSTRTVEQRNGVSQSPVPASASISRKPLPTTPASASKERAHDEPSQQKIVQASSPPPEPSPPVVSIEVTSPPVTPSVAASAAALEDKVSVHEQSSSTGSGSSKKSGSHKRGISIDKINITKIFGSSNGATDASQTNGKISRAPSQKSTDTVTAVNGKDSTRRPSTFQLPPSSAGAAIAAEEKNQFMLSPPDSTIASRKQSRRNTLTVMVEPFKKQLTRGSKTAETPVKEKPTPVEKHAADVSVLSEKQPQPPAKDMMPPETPTFSKSGRPDFARLAIPGSTVKANTVMNWFRSKSKGKPVVDESSGNDKPLPEPEADSSQTRLTAHLAAGSSSSSVNQPTILSPTSEKTRPSIAAPSGHPQRSPSTHTNASITLADRVLGRHPAPKGVIRVHHGPVDPVTITTVAPPEVMKHVLAILDQLGMEVQAENDFKYRCVRPKRKRTNTGVREGGLAAFSMMGSAGSNGVDKRGLPVPSQQSFGGGGMLRGLLMRRQSSQVAANPSASTPTLDGDAEAVLAAAVSDTSYNGKETIYGDAQNDHGDEVRFSVELTRLDRLDGTYSLDIRRLKGNLRSYKFLYDTVRACVSLAILDLLWA
ncbi:Pkinase-domain-containing protein [Panus rudis PR-1116 ss-1]|nr:Pkinase-domain-containing protein [Panus rudis PR-1116 ss-1]